MSIDKYLASALVAASMFLPNEIEAQKYVVSGAVKERLEGIIEKMEVSKEIDESDYVDAFPEGRYKEVDFGKGKERVCIVQNLLSRKMVSYEVRKENGDLILQLGNYGRHPPIAADFTEVDNKKGFVFVYKEYQKLKRNKEQEKKDFNKYNIVVYHESGLINGNPIFDFPQRLKFEVNRKVFDSLSQLAFKREEALKKTISSE